MANLTTSINNAQLQAEALIQTEKLYWPIIGNARKPQLQLQARLAKTKAKKVPAKTEAKEIAKKAKTKEKGKARRKTAEKETLQKQ